jgi:hypothetical protein
MNIFNDSDVKVEMTYCRLWKKCGSFVYLLVYRGGMEPS